MRWKCEDCGAGKAKRTQAEIDLWESRGKCGGAFKPGRLRPLQDAAGFYVTPLSVATEPQAPCFEPEERFRSCPVALAGSDFAVQAYKWHGSFTKPGRREFLPDRLSALVEEAVYAVDHALALREDYETEKMRKKNEGR